VLELQEQLGVGTEATIVFPPDRVRIPAQNPVGMPRKVQKRVTRSGKLVLTCSP